MPGIEFDFSELVDLANDFDAVAAAIPRRIRQAVEISARDVKDDARKRVQGRRHFRQAAAAIDYELSGFSGGLSGISAEVGYDKAMAVGKLGNLVEFGAPNAGNQLAPGGELQAALNRAEEGFVHGVEQAVSDAMRDVGL